MFLKAESFNASSAFFSAKLFNSISIRFHQYQILRNEELLFQKIIYLLKNGSTEVL